MNAGTRWIAVVVALLGGNALAVGILIAKAGDPSARVVPHSYQRGIEFDREMIEQAESAALGWGVKVRLIATTPGRGRIELDLTDGGAAPIGGAMVAVEVRHRSKAAGVTVALTEGAPGRYSAELAVTGRGLHELGVRAHRGDLGFAAARTIALEGVP